MTVETASAPAAAPPPAAPAPAPAPAPAAADVHPLRNPRLALPLAALLVLVNLPFLHAALRGSPEVTQAVPFKDDFNRATLGPDYWANGGLYRIADGQLFAPGSGNNPLWLKARLPADARIEFDVRGEGADGDIKWEAWGDGRNHSSGYVFLFGAWHNRESRIAKLDEHALTEQEMKAQLANVLRPYPRVLSGVDALLASIRRPFAEWSARRGLEQLEKGAFYGKDTPLVVKRADVRVTKGRTYHMVVTKKGGAVRWEMDGQLVLELRDPAPLSGGGHDRFGFSTWANDAWFDNLKIDPL